MPKILYLILY